MDIKNLSPENKIKLIIAEQIIIFKENGNFKGVEERLNMLNLKIIQNTESI